MSALTALQDQFRARDTGKVYAALVFGAWPRNLKVIDLALHKTLDAAGERHVRVVSPEHADGRRTVATHFNKAHKGRLARALAAGRSDPDDAAAVAAVARRAGMRVEGDGNQFTIVVS